MTEPFEIFKATNPQIPANISTDVDQLRLYDRAIFAMLGEYQYLDKDGNRQNVQRVFASPDRAWAEMWRILNKDSPDPNVTQDPRRNIPLPFISIFRGRQVFEHSRWSRADTRTLMGFTVQRERDPEYGNKLYIMPFPMPYYFPYQVDIWTRNRTTSDYFEQFMGQKMFSSEFFLPIDFTSVSPLIGTKIIPVSNEGFVDNSSLEDDEDNRVFRFTWTIHVHGWYWRPIHEAHTVRKVLLGVYDASKLWERAVSDAKKEEM